MDLFALFFNNNFIENLFIYHKIYSLKLYSSVVFSVLKVVWP